MSIPVTPSALATSTTPIVMGTTLELDVDAGRSILALVKTDGSTVNVWGKTLQFAFAPLQTAVTLFFTPVSGTDPVTASYIDGLGTTVQSTDQSGSATIAIQRPPSTGVTFDIKLEQGSASVGSGPTSFVGTPSPGAASARAPSPAPAAAASNRMASAASPSPDVRPGPTLSSSRAAGLVSTDSTNPQPTGPGARLQTRLVFSTVEPPPDPDGRPTLPAG
jgi:hypothetical protein